MLLCVDGQARLTTFSLFDDALWSFDLDPMAAGIAAEFLWRLNGRLGRHDSVFSTTGCRPLTPRTGKLSRVLGDLCREKSSLRCFQSHACKA